MPGSLSVLDAATPRRESTGRRLARLAAIVWLLVVQPVSLALTLDRALPRVALFGTTAWLLIAARVTLTGAGIAVARRLRAHEPDAWRAVALWACVAIGTTLLGRAWPELPTGLAPSEARVATLAAVVRDAVLALAAARLARGDGSRAADDAQPRDSS
jgi:hypothetical protein